MSDISEKIINFWFPNNQYQKFWFDGSKDQEINELFGDTLIKMETEPNFDGWNKVALIILFDQFTRNISRFNNNSDYTRNDHIAFKMAMDMLKNNEDMDYPTHQRIFILMPLRHQKKSQHYGNLLKTVLDRIAHYREPENISLQKFKNATIKCLTDINMDIEYYDNNDTNYNKFDVFIKYVDDILDQNCLKYNFNKQLDLTNAEITDEPLYKTMQKVVTELFPNYNDRNIGISLSGGVDSMCISFILKKLVLEGEIKSVTAVHINYGNRLYESLAEEEFVKDWCEYIKIPLIVRQVTYMKRDNTDRDVYESETKKIRFNTYKYAQEKNSCSCFCLGHHQGDITETVIMNVLKGRDILDLEVMKLSCLIEDTKIVRPLLNHHKSEIFKLGHKYQIPYTRNSTPEWSCRGVLRNKILPVVCEQFGTGSLRNINQIGSRSTELNNLVDKLMDNVFKSIHYGKCGCHIEKSIIPDNSVVFWSKFLRKIFYQFNLAMITNKNLNNFIEWFSKIENEQTESNYSFSNNCICIIDSNKMYILINETFNAKNWYAIISPCDERSDNSKITYSDIVNGYFKYYEYDTMKQIEKYSEFQKSDPTRQLFVKIPTIRNFVPKYTSNKSKSNQKVKVEIYFNLYTN